MHAIETCIILFGETYPKHLVYVVDPPHLTHIHLAEKPMFPTRRQPVGHIQNLAINISPRYLSVVSCNSRFSGVRVGKLSLMFDLHLPSFQCPWPRNSLHPTF